MFEMCLDGVWKGSSKNSEIKKSVNYSIGGGGLFLIMRASQNIVRFSKVRTGQVRTSQVRAGQLRKVKSS